MQEKMCANRLSDCSGNDMEFDITSDFALTSDTEINGEELNIASIQDDKEDQVNFLDIVREPEISKTDEALSAKGSRHNGKQVHLPRALCH